MKYCTQCGRPSADENKFCQACGKAFQTVVAQVPAQEPVAPAAQPVVQVAVQPAAPVPAGMTSTPLAKRALKEVLQSVLFFVATILFSVVTALTLIRGFLNQMTFGDVLSDFSSEFEMMNMGTTGSVDLTNLIFLAPYGLICAGLWVLFAQGKKENADTIGTGGIQLIKVGTIIHMSVVCGLLGLIVILLSVYQVVALFDYSYDEALILIPIVFMIVAALLVFLVLTYVKALQLLNATRRIVTDGATDFKVSQFLIVMCYVQAGLTGLSAVASISSSFLSFLIGACEAGFMIMIALCLSNYKNELKILQAYLAQDENRI